MICKRCKAKVQEGDLFCSKCGAPVEHTFQKDYYDDNLYRREKGRYRDSFLEKKEERSHALLMTVTVLLVIAVLAVAFVILFFFSRRNRMQSADNRAVSVVSGGDQKQAGTGNGGQEGEIVILTEEESAGPAQTEKEAAIDTTAAAGGDAAGMGETDIEEESLSAPPRETDSSDLPPAADQTASALDSQRLDQIWQEDSSAVRWGVFVYDFNHFKEYSTDKAEEPMYASALISVPILYTTAVLLDQGQITLNDQITYGNSIGGRGEANPQEREGNNYPLTYYLTTMLIYSDNNCMNSLLDYLGLEQINSVCQSAGFTSVDLQRKIVAEVTDGKDNYVSARDLAGMLKELFLGKYKTLGSEFIRQYFKIDAGDGYRTVIGLADPLPSSTLFLNQNGRGDTRYNEVALISDDTHQYIISIMCSGDYGFQYETAVENISNYVYQSLT